MIPINIIRPTFPLKLPLTSVCPARTSADSIYKVAAVLHSQPPWFIDRSDLTTAEVSRPSGKASVSRDRLWWRKTRSPKVYSVPRDSFLCASNINDIKIMFIKTFYMTREISTL